MVSWSVWIIFTCTVSGIRVDNGNETINVEIIAIDRIGRTLFTGNINLDNGIFTVCVSETLPLNTPDLICSFNKRDVEQEKIENASERIAEIIRKHSHKVCKVEVTSQTNNGFRSNLTIDNSKMAFKQKNTNIPLTMVVKTEKNTSQKHKINRANLLGYPIKVLAIFPKWMKIKNISRAHIHRNRNESIRFIKDVPNEFHVQIDSICLNKECKQRWQINSNPRGTPKQPNCTYPISEVVRNLWKLRNEPKTMEKFDNSREFNYSGTITSNIKLIKLIKNGGNEWNQWQTIVEIRDANIYGLKANGLFKFHFILRINDSNVKCFGKIKTEKIKFPIHTKNGRKIGVFPVKNGKDISQIMGNDFRFLKDVSREPGKLRGFYQNKTLRKIDTERKIPRMEVEDRKDLKIINNSTSVWEFFFKSHLEEKKRQKRRSVFTNQTQPKRPSRNRISAEKPFGNLIFKMRKTLSVNESSISVENSNENTNKSIATSGINQPSVNQNIKIPNYTTVMNPNGIVLNNLSTPASEKHKSEQETFFVNVSAFHAETNPKTNEFMSEKTNELPITMSVNNLKTIDEKQSNEFENITARPLISRKCQRSEILKMKPFLPETLQAQRFNFTQIVSSTVFTHTSREKLITKRSQITSEYNGIDENGPETDDISDHPEIVTDDADVMLARNEKPNAVVRKMENNAIGLEGGIITMDNATREHRIVANGIEVSSKSNTLDLSLKSLMAYINNSRQSDDVMLKSLINKLKSEFDANANDKVTTTTSEIHTQGFEVVESAEHEMTDDSRENFYENTTCIESLCRENTSELIFSFAQRYPIRSWKHHGWFTVEYLSIINRHWLKFPPTSVDVHYILGVVYVLIFFVGLFGNSLVVFMFFWCRSLRTPANTLVINLAISDLGMMCKTPIFIYNSYYLGPALGNIGCQIYGFIGGLTGTVSIITLSSIAIDRYLVIVYPLDQKKRINGCKAKLCILITWAYGFFFSVLPILNVNVGQYVPEGLLTSCSFDYLSDDFNTRTFIMVFFVAAWCVPFAIIVYCYFKILRTVLATQKMGDRKRFGSISSRHVKESERFKTEVKLSLVVIAVIFLWFLAWTPYAIVALLGYFRKFQFITPITSMIPALFCKISSCINPFIYAITHPKFRHELLNMINRMMKNHRHLRNATFRQNSMRKTSMAVSQSDELPSDDISTASSRKFSSTRKMSRKVSDNSIKRGFEVINSRNYMNREITRQLSAMSKKQCKHGCGPSFSSDEEPGSGHGSEYESVKKVMHSSEDLTDGEVEEVMIMVDYGKKRQR